MSSLLSCNLHLSLPQLCFFCSMFIPRLASSLNPNASIFRLTLQLHAHFSINPHSSQPFSPSLSDMQSAVISSLIHKYVFVFPKVGTFLCHTKTLIKRYDLHYYANHMDFYGNCCSSLMLTSLDTLPLKWLLNTTSAGLWSCFIFVMQHCLFLAMSSKELSINRCPCPDSTKSALD